MITQKQYRFLLPGLVLLGFISLLFYFSWWVQFRAWQQLLWLLVFVFAAFYTLSQIVGSWLLYLFARPIARTNAPPDDISIDVFVTAYNEPFELVKRTLTAACAMKGKHQTWLLDDGNDPKLACLALELGAGYLARSDKRHAKAGNINSALAHTSGDVIAVFDIDHTPAPNFLEHALKPFADPAVGFVQVMVSFSNQNESWVAHAAAETSFDFYNPTSFGMEAVGGTTMMGSNSLIRREALASIGGYQPGLAEDLATSIALHRAGWRSAYVPIPLAPGLAPSDLPAWFTQQLKWARGVFELLLTAYPRCFLQLTWGHRLAYAVRMTKYLIGPVIFVHLAAAAIVLFAGSDIQNNFQSYLLHLAPVVLVDMLIKQAAIRAFRHYSVPTTSLWSAITLVVTTWPVYTLAWMMALLRLPVQFRLTPKESSGRINFLWLVPQIFTTLLLISGLAFGIDDWRTLPLSIVLFISALMLPHFLLFYLSLKPGNKQTRSEQISSPHSSVGILGD